MAKRKKKEENLKLLAFVFAVVCVLFFSYYNNKPEETISNAGNVETKQEVSSDLKIYFLDVGQADSILITNNNHNMLIDAGNNEDGQHIVDYIKELNITDFDYIVGTHPHEDHIGGLDDIINNFPISNVLLPDVVTTTKTFEDVIDAIEKNNLEITIPEIDSEFNIGDAKFKIIYTGTDTKDLNKSSIILKMTFGETSYIFTGDTTSEIEKTLLDKDLKADVLKVAHHGSATSTSNQFLLKVKPQYAIISVAEKNSYNHPSKEILNRIKKFTNNIYLTSDLGTILLTSDGKNINITNFKTNTNGERK